MVQFWFYVSFVYFGGFFFVSPCFLCASCAILLLPVILRTQKGKDNIFSLTSLGPISKFGQIAGFLIRVHVLLVGTISSLLTVVNGDKCYYRNSQHFTSSQVISFHWNPDQQPLHLTKALVAEKKKKINCKAILSKQKLNTADPKCTGKSPSRMTIKQQYCTDSSQKLQLCHLPMTPTYFKRFSCKVAPVLLRSQCQSSNHFFLFNGHKESTGSKP